MRVYLVAALRSTMETHGSLRLCHQVHPHMQENRKWKQDSAVYTYIYINLTSISILLVSLMCSGLCFQFSVFLYLSHTTIG
jgi:hypothetical protein